MRVVDVNILICAHRPEAANHPSYRDWLERVRAADEPLGIPGIVLAGFLRVVTNPRVFVDPTPLSTALEFARSLSGSPAVRRIEPGDRHWPTFVELSLAADAKGDLIPDAWLAALTMEHGATLITADRGFGRFPGLRWQHPLDADGGVRR